ncbi:MAG: SDR family NAD(P)-dependent oxidoreductase [Acidimicrobiia bacterium]|nr:SDR family NAD(P)-dependent oxidoreductase [Acidimicrobiia bacterium]
MNTALVTGPSSGIGRVTALSLGAAGYHVVAAGRSEPRIRPVVEAIRSFGGSAGYLPLDLASLASVSQAVEQLKSSGVSFDLLVNNAGVWRQRGLTVDGFEPHFGINHLGHFHLTRLLSTSMTPRARIVTVASAVHRRAAGIDFEAVTRPTRTRAGLDEYGVSKLANILFSRELARREPDVRTYAVHPGFSGTGIIPFWAKPFLRSRLISHGAAAATSIWCATDPSLETETGGYYEKQAPADPSPAAQDDALAAELWERSEQWCTGAPTPNS